MQSMIDLLDLSPGSLPIPVADEPYRRDQLLDWIYRQGVDQYDHINNLTRVWRETLASQFRLVPFKDVERFPSRDNSVRYLFTLSDGKQTEAVYMPYANRKTVCISSMVGCPAGCSFCATGALGFQRNLSQAEIVGQFLVVAKGEGIAPLEIRNVVLMGMGEALLNFDNALGAIRALIHPNTCALSPRRITLSTGGFPAKIVSLAGEGLPLVLAVSLHAPDDATRMQIIPTAHAYPIAEIVQSLHTWQDTVGRRITIEYTMLKDVNDSAWQAKLLERRLRGLRVHINLIPFNPWSGSGFEVTAAKKLLAFKETLESSGLNVSIRFSRGQDSAGACGQLALSRRNEGNYVD